MNPRQYRPLRIDSRCSGKCRFRLGGAWTLQSGTAAFKFYEFFCSHCGRRLDVAKETLWPEWKIIGEYDYTDKPKGVLT